MKAQEGGERRMRWFGLMIGMLLLATAGPAAADEAPLTRIAFGSCANQDAPQPIWDAVLAYKPELFIFAGDNVYGDSTGPELRELRAAYARTATIEGYARIRREVSTLAIWDDHDYGRNDAGGDFPYKEAAKAAFMEFWQVPADDARRRHEGLYDARSYGPPGQRVQVILLDLRWFRSAWRDTDQPAAPGKERYMPDDDGTKTMLGDAQWAWLATQLAEPAELRLIVSSTQVLAEGQGYERWGNFPHERQRLFDLIGATRAAGVVLLSGDRHIAGIYRTSAGAPYPLVELTSSGINRTWTTPTDLQGNRIGAPYGRENFGTVDIDWWAREIRLAARGMNGEPVRQLTVPLEQLKPAN